MSMFNNIKIDEDQKVYLPLGELIEIDDSVTDMKASIDHLLSILNVYHKLFEKVGLIPHAIDGSMIAGVIKPEIFIAENFIQSTKKGIFKVKIEFDIDSSYIRDI